MYRFYHSCVGWPKDAFIDGGLSDMIDTEIGITRRTFLKHVDDGELADIAEKLGYSWHHRNGLTMAGDWHVSYHRSKLQRWKSSTVLVNKKK